MAAFLPGATDRDEWIADLVATVTAPALSESDIGVSLVDGDRIVAMSRPMRARLTGVDLDPYDLATLTALIPSSSVDAISSVMASDRAPVRAVTRAVAYRLPTGQTDAVYLTVMRAKTSPTTPPVFVSYVWPTTPTQRNEAWQRAHERWVVTDACDRIVGGSPDTEHIHGLTLWALLHPEDVVNSLDVWNAARARGHRTRAGAGRVERMRVAGSRSGWTNVSIELRPLASERDRLVATTLRRSDLAPLARIRDPRVTLSAREHEVFEGIVVGERGPTIARRLGIAESTVRNLLARVERKLGVVDRTELIERYNPRLARASAGLALRSLGFAAGHSHATGAARRFTAAPGSRRAWVGDIARTVRSPRFEASRIGVALLDENRVRAANPAFDRLLGRSAAGMPVADFGAPQLVEDRERASDEIAGVWSFSERLPDGLLTASVVRRRPGELAVTLLYVQPAGPIELSSATNVGAALVDPGWKIVAVTPPRRAGFPVARVGDLAWPFVHPESLPDTIDAFDRVARCASGAENDAGDLEFSADALRTYGWGVGRNRLRAVCGVQPLVLWEGSRPFAPTTRSADPARLAALDERDIPLALFVLDGATVTRAAELLGLAEGTVRNRLSRIYRTLGVRSQRELVERYR